MIKIKLCHPTLSIIAVFIQYHSTKIYTLAKNFQLSPPPENENFFLKVSRTCPYRGNNERVGRLAEGKRVQGRRCRWAGSNDFLMRQRKPQLLRNRLSCPPISSLKWLRKAGRVASPSTLRTNLVTAIGDIGAICTFPPSRTLVRDTVNTYSVRQKFASTRVRSPK